MKTREEMAQELSDRKKSDSLSKEINEIKSVLSTFLSEFRGSSVNIKHNYRLEDEIALKELKKAIDSVPEEIIINNHHSTDKVSTKFLWWYFVVSTLVLFLSLGYGINQSYKYEDVPGLEKKAFIQGKNKGYQEVFETLPKTSQDFLKKKHPNVFEK
jgi:hypothetical protein